MRLLLIVLLSCVSPFAYAQAAPANAGPAPISAAETKIDAAFADFSARSIEMLSQSKSPRDRWTAAWMLLGDATRATAEAARAAALRARADLLFAQALKDGIDDPVLLSWALLDPPVAPGADAKTLATARLVILERMRKLEPDNAMVWVAALPEFGKPGTVPEGMRLLAKAAGSKRFDTHFGDSLRTLIHAYDRVPPPTDWPETKGLEGWDGMQAQDLAAVMAVGVANAVSMPYLSEVNTWCQDGKAHPWLEECQKLAKLMTENSDALVVKSLGINLLGKLTEPTAVESKRIQSMRRDLAYVAEMGMQKVGPGQPISYRAWHDAWSVKSATEISVGRALLKLQGLPENAPASYVPAWDRAPPQAQGTENQQ